MRPPTMMTPSRTIAVTTAKNSDKSFTPVSFAVTTKWEYLHISIANANANKWRRQRKRRQWTTKTATTTNQPRGQGKQKKMREFHRASLWSLLTICNYNFLSRKTVKRRWILDGQNTRRKWRDSTINKDMGSWSKIEATGWRVVREGTKTTAWPAGSEWIRANVRRARRRSWKKEKAESAVGNFDEEGMIDYSVLEDMDGSGAIKFVDEKQSR